MSKAARSHRATWEQRIARFRDSDLTAAEFAAEIGVNVNTLKQWKWRLDKEQRSSSPRSDQRRRKPLSFVEVPAEPSGSPATVEVAIGRAVVRIGCAADDSLLRRVLAMVCEVA